MVAAVYCMIRLLGARGTKTFDRGASLVEYALLVALIALVALTAVTFLGTTTGASISSSSSSLFNP